MNEPVPPAAPPPPARYGLPQAAGETLFLVGLSMVGLLAIHLPVVGPFATHLSMAAAALLLLYQAGMKVTWLPPSGSWRPFVRPTLLAAVLLLPLAAGYVHAELTAAAPRDPVAWRAAMEQLAARMAAVPFWATAGMFVRLGVVVPMAEELAFRGYLHSRLLRHDARRWQLGQLAWSRAALVS
ncbi:MAG TPA: hypothetical protein DCM14_07760, partial [Clostridiales bacterium UBA8153]|nr:hypothetical protein [Clostridiales bacterium UBA8153]